MLDDIHDIDDWSQITIWALIDRIQRSSGFDHMVYRETELDELWRILDIASATAVRNADPDADRLLEMKAVVMKAHDQIGDDSDLQGAAETLKAGFM